MNFEDLQKSWQAQDAAKTISINTDLLLSEVRRNQKQFRNMILARDVREVGVALLLVPIFIFMGVTMQDWTDFLIAFDCLIIGGYMVLDRWHQRKNSPKLGDALRDCVVTSLTEVNHQIWLLKNVLWWYLLPGGVPIALSFCWPLVRLRHPGWDNLGLALGLVVFVVLLYWWIYWLNQRCVRKQLEPRQQELEKLLAGLESENALPTMKTKKPLGPLIIVLVATVVAVAVAVAAPHLKTKHRAAQSDSGIEAVRAAHDLPALAVVVTKDGQICDRAVAGVRKWNDAIPATTNDTFHIGSCTKSMTATLAAMFIEQGKLRWDTTIAEVFPELKGRMDKQYETVTVEQLLHHRGGVPRKSPSAAWRRAWKEIGTPTEQRREFIEAVLSAPPEATPGTEKVYSNQGYTIVGAMLEKISGQDFESLMTEKLFKPLHMDTAGFGPPGTKGQTDQPWGHVRKLLVTLPVQVDNPPAISPAGRVHCSLDDLARYAMFHLQRGTNGLLKPETMARLHASPVGVEFKGELDNYACGWARLERGRWGGGTVLYHNGSNTMWYIVMWLAPEKDFCVIVATNIYNDEANDACDEMAVQMIKKWLPDSKL